MERSPSVPSPASTPEDDVRTRRRGPGWTAAVAAAALLVTGLGVAPSLATAGGTAPVPAPALGRLPEQVVTWSASADRTELELADQSVRNVIRTGIGGTDLRVSLSNAFGTGPVTFSAAHVGTHAGEGAVEPGTNRALTFSGSPTVTVPPGAEVLSDPLPGRVPEQQDLAVSVDVDGDAGAATGHNLARQESYVSVPGAHAADEGGEDFSVPVGSWYFLDGVVVTAPRGSGTVAALGDSITDGFGATEGANTRWPDFLARRLLDNPRFDHLSVANQGISGNRVLTDSAGVSALARLDRDVLAQPGVETVVVLEGINDISNGATAEEVIAGHRQLIARAHAEGTCVIGATLTPFESAGPEREAERTAVNEFIRTSGEFDDVVDFDAATRDPQNLDKLLPAYDSGDDLHPSDAGYQAMADSVDLRDLECRR